MPSPPLRVRILLSLLPPIGLLFALQFFYQLHLYMSLSFPHKTRPVRFTYSVYGQFSSMTFPYFFVPQLVLPLRAHQHWLVHTVSLLFFFCPLCSRVFLEFGLPFKVAANWPPPTTFLSPACPCLPPLFFLSYPRGYQVLPLDESRYCSIYFSLFPLYLDSTSFTHSTHLLFFVFLP